VDRKRPCAPNKAGHSGSRPEACTPVQSDPTRIRAQRAVADLPDDQLRVEDPESAAAPYFQNLHGTAHNRTRAYETRPCSLEEGTRGESEAAAAGRLRQRARPPTADARSHCCNRATMWSRRPPTRRRGRFNQFRHLLRKMNVELRG